MKTDPPGKPEYLEQQLLADFYDCDRTVLSDPRKLADIIFEAFDNGSGFPAESRFHRTGRKTLAGFFALPGIAVTVRTDATNRFAAIELTVPFSEKIPKRKGFETLKRGLNSKSYTLFELKRGFIEPGS